MNNSFDGLYLKVIKYIEKNKTFSASRLQAQFTIGYPMAMKIVNKLLDDNLAIRGENDIGYVYNESGKKLVTKNKIFKTKKDLNKEFSFYNPKLDKIIDKDNKVFILTKDDVLRKRTGIYIRSIQHRFLNSLLTNNIPCALFHCLYGNEFENLKRMHKDFIENEDPLSDNVMNIERDIATYPLYEFKTYGNNIMIIADIIENVLVGKVKYIFINDIYFDDKSCDKLLEKLFYLAEKNNLHIIVRDFWLKENLFAGKKLCKKLNKSKLVFSEDGDNQFVVTAVDKTNNFVTSEPIKMIDYATYTIE